MIRKKSFHGGFSDGPIMNKFRKILEDPNLTEIERATKVTGALTNLPTFELRESVRARFPQIADICKKAIKKIDDHDLI